MPRTRILAILLFGLAAATAANAQVAAPRVAGTATTAQPLPPWRVPDIAALPDDAAGRTIRYGQELINHTTALIGPDAPAAAPRYSGNGLECTNCHINAGTARFALPLVGIANLYPTFSARINAQQDLAGRVNDCMQRSMNGRPLPLDSREMQSILAYLKFLASEQPAGESPIGRAAPQLPLPTRAANPKQGAAIYQSVCAACHQPNGQGVQLQIGDRVIEKRRYVYPPLWGPESYNDAAGMARVITGAWFVHANMPIGITFQYPILSPEAAYDVMAFVDTQPRPKKAGLFKDYPDLWLKPIGTVYPPWVGRFSATQNRLGPWQPILAWRKQNEPPAGHGGPPAANDLEQPLQETVAR
jgi:thiosulfate dehydrogenase